MRPIRTFNVVPALPEELLPLLRLAHNLRWSWNHDSIELFRRLDRDQWEECGHNPVRLIGLLNQTQIDTLAADPGFLAHMNRVVRDLDDYLANHTPWYDRTHASAPSARIAYFSAEFGITECLSIFAGGLGLLAGDHLKSASDLGIPLVAVGLIYQEGYFLQRLNEAGWQQEQYVDNDFNRLPITLCRDASQRPVQVSIQMVGREVRAQVWRADVGRIPLLLLDTNLSENDPDDRSITDRLYGGDQYTRLRQEIVLGIGGFRALEALGFAPTVYHMNEGHSAFLSLERARSLMAKHRIGFDVASEIASAGLLFTTHTPVAAGHDYFPPDWMESFFADYRTELGLSHEEFMALGRKQPTDPTEPFCMTVLALRMAGSANGVSKLHREVSREMWTTLWQGVPAEDVPICHVTNGVHIQSWISCELNELYDRYLGPLWREEPVDGPVWGGIYHVPADELWRTHEGRRERLVSLVRKRLRSQLERRGATQHALEEADSALSPDALTLCFARRFATYKRATLLFRDPERLARLLNQPDRPVQLVFAGKAHPRDEEGKALIQQIYHLSQTPAFKNRLIFLENYDTAIARSMLQGADVWLNTPRRPMEASGTSGMKAAANGVLNLSILDGWWDEAWRDLNSPSTPIGWAIGCAEEYRDTEEQDRIEAELLYNLLEQDVIPLFYERRDEPYPRRWVERMKSSVGTLCHVFNSHRMVQEYTERFYEPMCDRVVEEMADGLTVARGGATWRARLKDHWSSVRVEEVLAPPLPEIKVGTEVTLEARVRLGDLSTEDVRVEFYVGPLDARGNISHARTIVMEPLDRSPEGVWRFRATVRAHTTSGTHGYNVRVVPARGGRPDRLIPGYITWASANIEGGEA